MSQEIDMAMDTVKCESQVGSTMMSDEAIRALVVSSTFPSSSMPLWGPFIKERCRFVTQLPDVETRVVSPVPYFPPIKRFPQWYCFSQTPRYEEIDGLKITHPRYLMLPKVGGYLESRLLAPIVRRAARRVRAEFDFNLIDAHYIYPDGAAAVRLAKETGLPLVITCRGEDILRYPEVPIIGSEVRMAARFATRVVALSEEIADAIEGAGGDRKRIRVIPNGVDCDKFRPIPQDEARRELGLPLDRPIVLSVGNTIPRKGFHLLVDAMPAVRQEIPNAMAVIVGGQARSRADYTADILRRVSAHGLENDVVMAGAQPHGELYKWLSAADIFVLLTSREGSPNVVMESLACGLPTVGTRIGGIPEILADRELGMLVPERTAESAAPVIVAALRHSWDRTGIRRKLEQRSWHSTAQAVREVFREAVAEGPRSARH